MQTLPYRGFKTHSHTKLYTVIISTKFHFVFQIVKMASLQWVETPRVPVVSFLLFTRERFTGDAQLKTKSRNGVRSLKCLNWTEDGATVRGK